MLENAILTYTNMDIFRGSLRVESPHYSRKFWETYYQDLGWSKAIDFTTRFGFSKGIAQTLLKKGSTVTRERERNLPRNRLHKFFVPEYFMSRERFDYQGVS